MQARDGGWDGEIFRNIRYDGGEGNKMGSEMISLSQAWMAGWTVRPYWNQEHQMKSKLGWKYELSGKIEFEGAAGHLNVVMCRFKTQGGDLGWG